MTGAGSLAGARAAVVAVIPARSGSKGVPGKNVKLLAGRPLIAWTIEAALAARTIDRVIVSTDGEEIAAVACAHGAEVVRRPPELATDEATTESALLHVLDTLAAAGEPDPDYVVTLEPTSPLRSAALIDTCVRLAVERGAECVATVVENRACLGRVEGGVYRALDPSAPRRRQLREPLFEESSTVWVTATATLRRRSSVLAETVHAVVASPWEAIDINTALDFVIAEAVMRWKQEEEGS